MVLALNKTQVRVYDSRIALEFSPVGQVGRFADGVADKIIVRAIQEAPARTGELRAAHRKAGTLRRGLGTVTVLRNNSKHAVYVHNGTANDGVGWIIGTGGRRLKVPYPAPAGTKRIPRSAPGIRVHVSRGHVFPRAVRGQRANPWFERAAQHVIRTERLNLL